MSRRSSLNDFGLATLLAAGVQLVMLVAAMFIDKPLERFFEPPNPGTLRVHRSGHVVLEQQTGGFRSLSGQPLDAADVARWLRKGDRRERWLSPTALLGAATQRILRSREDWGLRVAELQGDPQVAWFLVQPRAQDSHAYCVGYGNATKERFGYLGRKGFRNSEPPREEWFTAVGARSQMVISGVFPPGLVFLATEDRVWELDLIDRSVRVVFESPDIVSLGASPGEKAELFVRTSSKIIVIDRQERQRTSWKIPDALRREDLQWYELADGGALTSTLRLAKDNLYYVDYIWLDRDGTITHAEQLKTRLGLPVGPEVVYLLVAPVTPTPLTFSLLSGIAVPLASVRQGQEPDFPTALAHTLNDAWPALLVVYLLAAVLAWLTYRRQTRYALPGAGPWAAFVFVFGLPGWLAYRWHRPWPVLAECEACHRTAPRDREICTACGQLFPPPPTLGTEVFA